MVKHKVATRATSLSAQGLRSVARHVGGLRVRQPLHTRFALSPPDDINTADGCLTRGICVGSRPASHTAPDDAVSYPLANNRAARIARRHRPHERKRR